MRQPEIDIVGKRLLARKLMHQGQEYSLVLVQISPDRQSIDVTPFFAETASTVFISPPICSYRSASGFWHLAYRKPND